MRNERELLGSVVVGGMRWVAWIGLICGAVMLVLWLLRKDEKPNWFSDPVALRASDYGRISDGSVPLRALDESLLEQIVVKTNAAVVQVESPDLGEEVPLGSSGYTVEWAGIENTVLSEGAEIALRYVAVADLKESRFYRPRWHSMEWEGPLGDEILDAEVPDEPFRRRRSRGCFPAFQASFVFGPNTRLLDLAMYDKRSRAKISGPGMTAGRDNATGETRIQTEMMAWHSTPAELVLTVADGPMDISMLELSEVGAQLRHGSGILRWLGTASGKGTHQTGMQANGKNVVESALTQPAGQSWTTFVFGNFARWGLLGTHLEFLGADGKVIGEGGGSKIIVNSVAVEAEEVKRVRVKSYRHVRRIVFSVPELAGLPVEKSSVTNLFDVKVPLIMVRDDHEMLELIGRTVQMEVVRLPPGPALHGGFPRVYRNVTPAQLLGEYGRGPITSRHSITVNSTDNTIEVQLNPLGRWWLWGKQFIRDSF